MSSSDLGVLIRNARAGKQLKDCANLIPRLEVSAKIQPITRGILRVTLTVEPDFPKWNAKIHGSSLGYYIWVEDYENNVIYHHEFFLLHRKQFFEGAQLLAFTIPVFEPLPPQYVLFERTCRSRLRHRPSHFNQITLSYCHENIT